MPVKKKGAAAVRQQQIQQVQLQQQVHVGVQLDPQLFQQSELDLLQQLVPLPDQKPFIDVGLENIVVDSLSPIAVTQQLFFSPPPSPQGSPLAEQQPSPPVMHGDALSAQCGVSVDQLLEPKSNDKVCLHYSLTPKQYSRYFRNVRCFGMLVDPSTIPHNLYYKSCTKVQSICSWMKYVGCNVIFQLLLSSVGGYISQNPPLLPQQPIPIVATLRVCTFSQRKGFECRTVI